MGLIIRVQSKKKSNRKTISFMKFNFCELLFNLFDRNSRMYYLHSEAERRNSGKRHLSGAISAWLLCSPNAAGAGQSKPDQTDSTQQWAARLSRSWQSRFPLRKRGRPTLRGSARFGQWLQSRPPHLCRVGVTKAASVPRVSGWASSPCKPTLWATGLRQPSKCKHLLTSHSTRVGWLFVSFYI